MHKRKIETSEKAKSVKIKEFRACYTGRILYSMKKNGETKKVRRFKYLRHIWQSSYTSQRIHIIMMSMVVKLIVNLKHLQKEMIDTFFTNYQNNMMKKILLTSLSLTLYTTTKNG